MLHVALDRKIDGLKINNDRVFLAKLVGDPVVLGSLCRKLGVPSLCDFQSYDPQFLAEFIDDPQKLAAAMLKPPPLQWFDSSKALPVLKALRLHFEQARFIMNVGANRPARGNGNRWIVPRI
jgi:hypothetical protein